MSMLIDKFDFRCNNFNFGDTVFDGSVGDGGWISREEGESHT